MHTGKTVGKNAYKHPMQIYKVNTEAYEER